MDLAVMAGEININQIIHALISTQMYTTNLVTSAVKSYC